VKTTLITTKGPKQIKAAIAEAEMILGGAKAYVYHASEQQWQKLSTGEELTSQERVDVRLSRLGAFQSARDVCRLLYDAMGDIEQGVLDRAMRDTETMCQDPVAYRKGLREVGRFILNLDSAPVTF
tara:strand:+ start:168 stop:545 length:378 start_codon:yes stop_codon:yes gene_type:complete